MRKGGEGASRSREQAGHRAKQKEPGINLALPIQLLSYHLSLITNHSRASTDFEIGMVTSNFGSIPPNAEPDTLPCLSRITNDGSWSTLNLFSVTTPSESRRTGTLSLLPATNFSMSALVAKFFDFALLESV